MTFPGMSGDTTKEEKMNVLPHRRAREREGASVLCSRLQAGGDDVEEQGRLLPFFYFKEILC